MIKMNNPNRISFDNLSSEEYDQYLNTFKEGRFVRKGKWVGFNKAVLHQCTDLECLHTWSPIPSECVTDNLYCPLCVCYSNNNLDRFNQHRLKWTADVPNTFYVYQIVDPFTDTKLIKFGRTKEVNPDDRYPSSELSNYKMELVFSLRGKLVTMIKIENWWKDEAKNFNIFVKFSLESFRGRTETIKYDKELLLRFVQESLQKYYINN